MASFNIPGGGIRVLVTANYLLLKIPCKILMLRIHLGSPAAICSMNARVVDIIETYFEAAIAVLFF